MSAVVGWFAAAFAQQTVTLPLSQWEARQAHHAAQVPQRPVALTLGGARWQGTADPDTLSLSLTATLQVRVDGDGTTAVPLIDARAVLVSVDVGGEAVAVSVQDDLHVWAAAPAGEHTVTVHAIVRPEGQRGAPAYDFRVPRTAATRLAFSLPQPDLKPEITGAVRTTVRTEGTSTYVTADLAPTDRIALLGLRDLTTSEAREPKLFADTQHLVSVDEQRIEIFSVFRYTLLYAGARRFDLFVPEGFVVESADGQGAYGTTLEPTDGGTRIHGETAVPMRETYEVSLRLSRSLPTTTASRIELPRALGVEREQAWVGVEAPGRIVLEEVAADGLDPVDGSLLPPELIASSVSPLLAGFHSDGTGAIRLRATPLPEVDVRASRIDHVEAVTVLSASGRAETELNLTLRNQFRPGLVLTLPPGSDVTRAMLDGSPVVPTKGQEPGTVVLPLLRSDRPFTVQVLLTTLLDPPRWLGTTALTLPSFELPASAIRWQVHLPDTGRWGELQADLPSQTLTGTGQWLSDGGGQGVAAAPAVQLHPPSEGGTHRTYHRYWVPAAAAMSVRALHSVWNPAPAGTLALGVVVLLGAGFAVRSRRRTGDPTEVDHPK